MNKAEAWAQSDKEVKAAKPRFNAAADFSSSNKGYAEVAFNGAIKIGIDAAPNYSMVFSQVNAIKLAEWILDVYKEVE